MANSLSRNARLFTQAQPIDTLLTIPNASGVATMAIANYTPHVTYKSDLEVAMLVPPDKTGTRTAEPGVPGRRMVKWSASASLRSSGADGTAPPLAPIWSSVFGASATIRAALGGAITGATNASPIVSTQVAHGFATGDVIRVAGVLGNKAANGVWVITVLTADTYSQIGSSGSGAYTSGGTSARSRVLYRLTDNILSFVAGHFRTPATLMQTLTYGSVTRQATLRLGQDIAEVSFEGMAPYKLDSDTFSAETDVELQAGLTAFPVEPTGTFPTDGGIIAGFTGRAVLGGSDFANIRSVELQITTGNELVTDNFGRFTPNESEGDLRAVSANIALSDKDDAGARALYAAFKAKTPVDIILQIGTVQYKTFVIQLKGVQFEGSTLDDGQRRMVRNYSNCKATGSAIGALDEIKIDIL